MFKLHAVLQAKFGAQDTTHLAVINSVFTFYIFGEQKYKIQTIRTGGRLRN